MTVLMMLATPGTVFAASDTRSHMVATGQALPTVQKLEVWNDIGIWGTGGYAAANATISPLLPSGGSVHDLNAAVKLGGQQTYEKYAKLAKEANIVDQGVYSLTAVIEGKSQPGIYSNHHIRNEFQLHEEQNAFVVFATNRHLANTIAKENLNSYVHGNSFQADAWAVDTIKRLCSLMPVAIGFLADLLLLRNNRKPKIRRVDIEEAFKDRSAWRVNLA